MRTPWSKNEERPPLPQFVGDKPESFNHSTYSQNVNFGQDNFFNAVKRVSGKYWRKISKPSTGSLSDGFGAGQTSLTNTSVGYRRNGDDAVKEEEDGTWTVDEVFVDNEHQDSEHTDSIQDPSTQGEQQKEATAHTMSARSGLLLSLSNWTRTSIGSFFNQSFPDSEKELEFQKQIWYMQKFWASAGAAFLVLNMILYLALNQDSNKSAPFNRYAYWVGLPIITMPVLPMVIFDFPRKYPVFFQIWFTTAVWYCGITEIVNMKVCHYFLTGRKGCAGKDFLAMLTYNMGLPAIMMFIVTKRLYNAIFQVVSTTLICALLIPSQGIFARNLVTFILFSMFVQFIHYQAEKNTRRVFSLTRNLKFERKNSDKARFIASKEQAAKEKLASYIFHEVRVPLNVAQLAFESLRVVHNVENHAEMWALDRSLSLMEKVLNDALDLSKMDSGTFENDNRPFPLHRTIRSAMDPIMIVSAAKGITVECMLDERVDALALARKQGADGLWVIGDELRLRQILTNLATNAVKFCPETDGKITLRTTLMHPVNLDARPSLDTPIQEPGEWLEVTDQKEFRQALDRKFEIRIECQDNGPGITPTDVRENRLFQPFVQAAAGKNSRRGTGLGLAIVRQIVSLTGGQLGLKCRQGEGATFWVEMPYKIASKAEVQDAMRDPRQAGFIASQNRAAVMNLALPDTELPIYTSFPSDLSDATPESASGGGAYFPVNAFDDGQEGLKMQLNLTGPPLMVSTQSSGRSFVSLDTAKELEVHPRPPNLPLPSPPIVEMPETLRVLVVDDDFLTRTIMKRRLSKSQGCIVDTAEDGEEFLKIMNDQTRPIYDLVTLDNHMPCMTGDEAIREFRKLGRTEYVVGCTGNALVGDTRKFVDAGVDDVLVKPLAKEKLAGILSEARQRRRIRLGLAVQTMSSSTSSN